MLVNQIVSYLQSSIFLGLKGCLHLCILGAEELERLGNRSHGRCGARDLTFQLVKSVNTLSLLTVSEALYEKL